jgi:hypothetical protein
VPRFQFGHRKVGGRKKGSVNKFTGLKDAFIEAFKEVGAARGLIEWIRKSNANQKVFYMLVARMLPADMRTITKFDSIPIKFVFDEVTGQEEPVREMPIRSAVPRSGAGPIGPESNKMTDEELEAAIASAKKEKRKHGKTRRAAKGKTKKAKG